MNGLKWCGSKKEPGIDFKSCPYQCSKQKAFWGQAAAKVSAISNHLGSFHKKLRGPSEREIYLLAFYPLRLDRLERKIDSNRLAVC